MSKHVNVLTDQELLEIIYADEVTPLDLVEDRDFGERICAEEGVKKILVDCLKVHIPPKTFPLFDHATCIAQSPVLGSLKHAIVVPDAMVHDALFLETASQNRGVRMRYFATRAEALAWLNEPPKKTSRNDKK